MLWACPFCRALYRPDEAKTCSECGVDLVPMQTLGPSHDAILDEPLPERLPEDEPLDWADFRRGRGALLALSCLGLVLFFGPWVEILMPEHAVRSGFDLARGRAGWLWGGAVGYFVLIPLVWTRRTISRMRGVRVVVTLLSAMTLVEVLMLASLPPRSRSLLPFAMEWRWAFYASGLTSLAATLLGLRFGGPLPPLPRAQTDPKDSVSPRLAGKTLH